MSKFFNFSSNKQEENNYNSENNVQGYITPSDTNHEQNNPNNTTFVYNSYANNNTNAYNNMTPLQNQIYKENTDTLEENEILEMPNNFTSSQENQKEGNPLNNANNPIPLNPIAEEKNIYIEELPNNVKANIFSVIGMMFGMLLTPGTTIIKNAKKYRSTTKAILITIWLTIISIILCIGTRILVGSFNKTYSAVTGTYNINLNFSNIFSLENYKEYLIITFLISFIAILVMSLIYYASSFLNSKGVPLGSYIMVSNLALIPFIVGVTILYPITNLVSTYIGFLVLIFTFLYTLVSLLIGINEILTFKSINRKILYNILNLSVVILIMIIIFIICIRMNILSLPEISI